jgi:hypothetical protein
MLQHVYEATCSKTRHRERQLFNLLLRVLSNQSSRKWPQVAKNRVGQYVVNQSTPAACLASFSATALPSIPRSHHKHLTRWANHDPW